MKHQLHKTNKTEINKKFRDCFYKMFIFFIFILKKVTT